MKIINNTQDLKELFGITAAGETVGGLYQEYTPLKDNTAGVSIGFSIKRAYPNNIRYKPPVKQNGEPDTLSMTHVIYVQNDEQNATKDKIFLFITKFNKFLSKHYDYDFADKDCPTKQSILESRKTPNPIDLENTDTYFFDRNKEKLVDEKGDLVEGINILNELFEKHCETVHLIKSLPLRTKIQFNNKLTTLYINISMFLEILLTKIWDREIIKGDSSFWGTVTKKDLRLSSIDSIIIFGYKISERIAVLFSVLALLSYTLYYTLGTQWTYVERMFSNVLLTTCFVIFILYILNNFLPNHVILSLYNYCRNKRWELPFKKHKV